MTTSNNDISVNGKAKEALFRSMELIMKNLQTNMEHLNKPEIYPLTKTKEEEITDWYLCEQTWENIEPKIVVKFNAESVHRRA